MFGIAGAFNSEDWTAGDISDGTTVTSTNYGFSWYKEKKDTYCGVSTLETVYITFTRVAVEGEEAYGDGTSLTYSFTVTLDFVTSEGDGKHQVTATLEKKIGTGSEKDDTVGETIYPDDVELLYNAEDGLYYLDGNGNKVTVDFETTDLYTDEEGTSKAVGGTYTTMSDYLEYVFTGVKCSDGPVLVGYAKCGICDHYIAIYASAEHTVTSGTSVSATCGTAGYITGECTNPADNQYTEIMDGAYKGTSPY